MRHQGTRSHRLSGGAPPHRLSGTGPTSGAANSGGTTGPQGTLGGIVQAAMGTRPGNRAMMNGLGDAGYLWVLVALEIGAIFWGRSIFSRRHGG